MRVISIQSHVVHGVVGNKAATFPLQLLGFDVDPLNSVQLSNHSAYPTFKGQVLGGAELEAIVGGLRANALMGLYSHVLTGYVGSATFLRAIAATVAEVRAANPSAVYVCDPVLGDEGRLYVPQELVGLHRELLVPQATLLTPNQFEAEQLSGVAIVDVESALRACDVLHALGAVAVVITSSSRLRLPKVIRNSGTVAEAGTRAVSGSGGSGGSGVEYGALGAASGADGTAAVNSSPGLITGLVSTAALGSGVAAIGGLHSGALSDGAADSGSHVGSGGNGAAEVAAGTANVAASGAAAALVPANVAADTCTTTVGLDSEEDGDDMLLIASCPACE